jgi:hypothetical protein
MPTQTERLQAHAEHLLDGFLVLRERYALLDPMLFNREVVEASGSGRKARGYQALRTTLFLSCAQDVAKLAADGDERAPSVRNLATALRDATVARDLKARYSAWVVPSVEQETDPEVAEALRLFEIDERAGRAVEFDRHLRDLLALADEFEASPVIESFRTIRDKVTAHTEVRFSVDKYQRVDIAELGLKWSDLATTITSLQRAVELIWLVFRNTGFAWVSLDRQLAQMADEFWLPKEAT